jgi:hypothetical protein
VETAERIRKRVPGIGGPYVVGPHSAMGELMLTLRDLRREENPEYGRLLAWTLELVEELASRPPGSEERNIVYASFFDNVHHLEGDCGRVLTRIGPNTRALVADYEKQTGRLCAPWDTEPT